MKKIIALILVFVCILPILVSCGMSKNPLDIRRKLEDEGYDCILVTNDEFSEYYVVERHLEEFDISTDGIEAVLIAGEFEDFGDTEEYLVVLFCEDAAAARKIKKEFISGLDDKDILELAEDYFSVNAKKNYKAGRNGNVVYIGHKDLVKAAK